ncbi:hypothetical protein LOK74_23745 [Brevibacillus humidisoli]|uniref:hypothetical protein n=1 Tax=Brevibacillus humidisoli TaxID=2895522 RepID=UPI001E3D261D|nr:hypothetical protein [Brevibacillus humidisoli]UFJ40960.1 hypothetical protein LOK74_23745 [Brevibacillus humidisoli]
MHRVRTIWLLTIMTCLLTVGVGTVATDVHAVGSQQQPPKQAIVVFIENMSFTDLQQLQHYPHVNKGLRHAYYAALTMRTPGARNDANAYLLMGSGGQALYTSRSGTVYHREEQVELAEMQGEGTAAERMIQMRGIEPAVQRESVPKLLFPGIYRLHAYNEDRPFTARIGLLGSTLQEAGIDVALYGNGDTAEGKQRHAALFAMNRDGEIPRGDVSARTTLRAAGYPDGIRTHYGYLLERIRQERSGLIVVQIADLARLYRLQEYLAPEHYQRQYQKVLADLDQFLGVLLAERKPGQLIMVTSPSVNPIAVQEKSLLTPMLLWKGTTAGGELASITTRQNGLVSGLDVLPTILSWLSVPIPEGVIGHVMSGVPVEGEKAVFSEADFSDSSVSRLPFFTEFMGKVNQIDRIYQNRSGIMYTYVMLQIIILIAAAVAWVWQKDGKRPLAYKLRRIVRLSLLAMLFFPALFLIEPLLSWSVPAPVIIAVIVMFALGGALLVEHWKLPQLLLAVAGFTVGCILLDGFTGGEAMRRSYLGYDPVIGARFYGLGNEYEGVLIGASILAVAALYEWQRRRQQALLTQPFLLTVAGFALTLYYMAAPSLGTNAGGFLAGAVGFGVTLFRLEGWEFGKKGFILCGGGLIGGIALIIALHLSSSEPLTHVGVVAADIVNGNWSDVLHIVQRKIEMNLRLIRVSSWSKMFVISLIVIGLLSLRPDRYLRRLSQRYPYLVRGFSGVVAGSLAGLVLNDSGIVSAATSIIFFAVPALFAALGEGEKLPSVDSAEAGS